MYENVALVAHVALVAIVTFVNKKLDGIHSWLYLQVCDPLDKKETRAPGKGLSLLHSQLQRDVKKPRTNL